MGCMRFVSRVRPAAEVAVVFAVLTGLLAPWLGGNHITTASLLYLTLTLGFAARHGYAVGLSAAVLANLVVNFFFVPPLHRFSVANGDNVIALLVFLAVAGIGAFMLSRSRREAARARENEAEVRTLLSVTREVADARTPRLALEKLCLAAARAAGARGCSLLSGESLAVAAATLDDPSNEPPSRDEVAAALEAWRRASPVGLSAMPGAPERLFVPIEGPHVAVLRFVGPVDRRTFHGPLFAGLANEFRATLRRARLHEEAARAGELEKAGEFKSLLLYSASHDLRTPLTAIKAAVSSLRDPAVDWSEADRSAFLETIETQADRLSRTVTNLLEMSRLERGARPRNELIEVGPLLAEAALLAQHPGHPVDACAPEGLWVRADYGLLMQALTNLIENAAIHGEPAAPIRLAASRQPGRVAISVANAGPPIAPADLPRVFDRFYRGSRGSGGGSGLGLALVKAIAEAADGSVSAESGDAGTTFTISLPASSAPV